MPAANTHSPVGRRLAVLSSAKSPDFVVLKAKALALHIKNGMWKARAFPMFDIAGRYAKHREALFTLRRTGELKLKFIDDKGLNKTYGIIHR
jgi:hypothetical protein